MEEVVVFKKAIIVCAVSAVALMAATNVGMAQAKLKWAHVYETSEPFHTAIAINGNVGVIRVAPERASPAR